MKEQSKAAYHLEFDIRFAKTQRELETIIAENIDDMDSICWLSAVRNQSFSDKLLEKYENHVPWKRIGLFRKLPETILEEHFEEIDWYDISCFQTFSKDFLNRHYYQLSLNKIITRDTLNKDIVAYAREIYEKVKDKPEFHKRWEENLKANKTFCPKEFKSRYNDYDEKTPFPTDRAINLNKLGSQKQKIIKKNNSNSIEKYKNMSKAELKDILSKRKVRVYYHDTLEILMNKCVESEEK